ncbi:MAG: PBSX family phage terminase large subunit [Acetobacterium sp.]|uniref:PBSX family phage terminase large subunit n=1 Tax=Acetobacterium sp. TaxID=1872094 RepID=UPI0032429465
MGRRVRQAIFKFKAFSKKQMKVLTWWMPNSPMRDKEGIIADGAIRSGKTLSMSLSFVIWAMVSFSNQNFGMCGKTIGSFRRNVLFWLKLMLKARGYRVQDHRADNLVIVTRGEVTNYFYVFGGKDERSQDLIQGITLAGVFFDEVALMPESFVNQATGRCSVEGSKFWFNCNPSNPQHWFKINWIDKKDEKQYLYLHFTMDDNLSLTEKIKARYRSMYSGVFYERFILGLWKAAEGVIYRQFADNPSKYVIELTDALKEQLKRDLEFISIGVDFGGNRSLTTFVATGFTHNFKDIYALADHAIKGQKGDIDSDRVNQEFIAFYRQLEALFPNITIRYCFADNEAQYLINGLIKACKNAGLPLKIGDSAKVKIVERIRCCNTLLNRDRLKVLSCCTALIGGLSSAVWDQKSSDAGKDVRLDNFSSDIDILDAFEYSFERFIKKLIGGG